MAGIKRNILGVLLDVDGTLVDSNDAHARAWAQALNESERVVTFEDARRLIGMGGDQIIPRLAGIPATSPEGERISKRRQEIFLSEYLHTIRPFPKVTELVHLMQDTGLKVAIASSANFEELSALLQIAGLSDLLERAASSSDAGSSKPSPDIVIAALEKLRVPADRAIMIGDTPYDVLSCQRAEVPIIALRCGGWRDAELRGALRIYEDPSDLFYHFESSPLYFQSPSLARERTRIAS